MNNMKIKIFDTKYFDTQTESINDINDINKSIEKS